MKRKILAAFMTTFILAQIFSQPFSMLAEASANDIAGEDEENDEKDKEEDRNGKEDEDYAWEADYTTLSKEIDAVLQGTGSRNVVVQAEKKIHVPADVLQALAGKNVTLAMHTAYSLTFSLTGTDMGRTMGEKVSREGLWIELLSYDAIPGSVKDAVVQRSAAVYEFGMEEKESYPFRVNVHMNFGAANAGKTAILYYYDERTDSLKFSGSFRATENGDVMFGLNRGDEYLAVIADRNACTVTSGDTLSGIASRTGVSLQYLLSANPQIKNADIIHPGQSIVIP